ncbi:hypothetical protein N300_14651, partial [Calypte anna]
AYVAGIVQRAEHSALKNLTHPLLYPLLLQLISLLDARKYPYFVLHIRSHTSLPGFLTQGNRQADLLTLNVNVLPNIFEQARIHHSFFHTNLRGLKRQFNLSTQQAADIISACPDYQQSSLSSNSLGTLPRGLQSLELWQTDVTHFPEFGRQKFIHVSIDTFSGAIYASCHTGETAKDVQRHFLKAFASLGIPKQIKTDNGPAYTSRSLQSFFTDWGITHITGIPYSPTGQAIVERAHHTLKTILQKQ